MNKTQVKESTYRVWRDKWGFLQKNRVEVTWAQAFRERLQDECVSSSYLCISSSPHSLTISITSWALPDAVASSPHSTLFPLWSRQTGHSLNQDSHIFSSLNQRCTEKAAFWSLWGFHSQLRRRYYGVVWLWKQTWLVAQQLGGTQQAES